MLGEFSCLPEAYRVFTLAGEMNVYRQVISVGMPQAHQRLDDSQCGKVDSEIHSRSRSSLRGGACSGRQEAVTRSTISVQHSAFSRSTQKLSTGASQFQHFSISVFQHFGEKGER